jgi:hypothetical protein
MSEPDYEALQAEILAARAGLTRGVAALVAKTDVKAQVSRRLRRALPWRREPRPAITATMIAVVVIVTCWRRVRPGR